MLLVVERGRERGTYEIDFDLPVSGWAEILGIRTEFYAEAVARVADFILALIAQVAQWAGDVSVTRPDESDETTNRLRVIDTPNETINRRDRP